MPRYTLSKKYFSGMSDLDSRAPDLSCRRKWVDEGVVRHAFSIGVSCNIAAKLSLERRHSSSDGGEVGSTAMPKSYLERVSPCERLRRSPGKTPPRADDSAVRGDSGTNVLLKREDLQAGLLVQDPGRLQTRLPILIRGPPVPTGVVLCIGGAIMLKAWRLAASALGLRAVVVHAYHDRRGSSPMPSRGSAEDVILHGISVDESFRAGLMSIADDEGFDLRSSLRGCRT